MDNAIRGTAASDERRLSFQMYYCLLYTSVLEAKEKPRELHEKSSGQSESPTQYGTEKIESVQYLSLIHI